MSANILVVDDQAPNRRLLQDLLSIKGYSVSAVESGEAALAAIDGGNVDLVLLDVVMPGMDGFAVLAAIRGDARHAHLPVVLCTSLDPDRERVRGLEAGADDFLQKPINHAELLARVRSLLRVKQLFDEVTAKQNELRALNETLEHRVRDKVAEVAQLSRLKRFFSSALAAKIVAGGADDPLASHRRDVAVVFVDLRGFTAFADAAAPEDVMRVLREFHAALGACIDESGGTIERFTGDGVMVFFNDPEPVTNPCASALFFARDVRGRTGELSLRWTREGFLLNAGLGVAYGYATVGAIGYEGRVDYGAIGSVTNLAARLCSEAQAGEILVQQRALALAGEGFVAEAARPFTLKGFRESVLASRLE
ncbi:MAG: response regulator [Casimicrobium sp.]